MTPTKTLLIIFCALLVVLYVQSYMKPKTEYTIVQTYLDRLGVDTLLDKYPIVIYDRIPDPRSLLKSLFAYSYVFENVTMTRSGTTVPYKAQSKYNILFNGNSNATIHIISPKYQVINKPLEEQPSTLQYVTVNLKKNQVLILPMSWHFACSTEMQWIKLDDVFSAMLKAFI